MRNKLITKMRDKLAAEGITSEISTGLYQNIIFKNAKGAEYAFATSILERYSGNQCVYHWEEGDGKIKIQHTDDFTDEMYYDRMRQMTKYVLNKIS